MEVEIVSKYLDKLANKLDIIKMLHDPMTREKCAELLGIDERTIRNYMGEGDIEIDNVVIPFQIVENSDKTNLSNSKDSDKDIHSNHLMERSTVHPVILPLNLTEVYMLTSGILDILGSNHEQYGAYKAIADKIYSQLSPYAKTRFDNSRHGFTQLRKVEYISESEMAEMDPNFNIGMASKMHAPVKIITMDDKVYEGVLNHQHGDYYLDCNGEIVWFRNLGIKKIKVIE